MINDVFFVTRTTDEQQHLHDNLCGCELVLIRKESNNDHGIDLDGNFSGLV